MRCTALKRTVGPTLIRIARMHTHIRGFGRNVTLTTFALMMLSLVAGAQAPPAPISISQAVATAVQNYPAVSVSQEQINAAVAGIQLARTAYLPRVDTLASVNRATRNNVFGLTFPQSVIPSISGP